MIYDDDHVKIHNCNIVWDGITQPDMTQGKAKFSLKVVVAPNNPDLQDMHNLSQKVLQNCPFAGVLPNGAGMPISFADAGTFDGGLYNGYVVLNCNTQRLPKVYDEMGKILDPMAYGPLIWGGQQVDVLVHAYHYDKAGNKGIATGLDAFSIIVSANAIQQNFGGKGIDTAGAFGPGAGQGQAQQGGFQQQAPQQGGFAPQQQAPAQQGGFTPQQGAPANNGQPYVDPNAAPAQQGGFQQQAPAQQGGFAPQQQQAPAQSPAQAQTYLPADNTQQAPAQQGGFAPQQQGGFVQQ